MKQFDPYHISREPDFKIGWKGDIASAYSPFFTDGHTMISKRHVIGEQWFKVLATPSKDDLARKYGTPSKCCKIFETCVSAATQKWTIKGRDTRESEDVLVLVSEAKCSCIVSTSMMILILAATQATEIYGKYDPKGALAFWRDSEPVGCLMPMNLRKDYQDK